MSLRRNCVGERTALARKTFTDDYRYTRATSETPELEFYRRFYILRKRTGPEALGECTRKK